ncbi:MipA/OmpV family protein [Sideroxydans sp. CL21]|uniref:MipA/OmpV family protein n=1 Tax=Sideroxydans sp. CL21 TaxID=2600596 RepID=UPI0012A8D37C|nr:MipA/OmpV family protein [Sideroxydans sp. CL21]VVC82340.1 Putative outer membrane protein [Sideroxydans sp. CL21]
MKKLALSTSVVSSLLCLSVASAQTELKPQWEAGAGFAAIDFPMYRGSNERRSYLLPIPYFVYRGDTVQINRERVRGLIFKRDRVEMDISVNGSVPAKGAIARQGMPDLDPTLEVGPSLNVHLYYSEDRKSNFDMRMPVRGAVASDFKHVQPVGWLFQPQLDADFLDVDHSGWNIGLVGGLVFSDQRYNQYFYNVAPQYATAARPAYAVGGGYAGTQCIFAFNKRRQDGRWMGGFMKWDNLNGAVFAESPLVKTRQYFTVGFAVTWTLDKSDKMVEVHND